MKKSNSYVYFALTGDNFYPKIITNKLNIQPTDFWRKGDKNKFIQQQKYSCWKLSSTGDEILDMNKLVEEVVNKLADKVEEINQLKEDYKLDSVLEIIMYIDMNEEESTPWISHNKKVIEFLYQTGTTTDIDIYKYNTSSK